MASTSIDWDEVQVLKSPKHKQVEVGFVKQGRGATVGSKDLCVRILAPDDYFPYKDESGHYYIAYIYEPAEVEITGTVTHTTGGICEPYSIVVPTEMDATSTFTIPRGSTQVRVDLTLNEVLVDVTQTPDYKAAYTATLTSVTNGKACGEPQCIKFNAGTSVIPPEPDPGPEPQPEEVIPPDEDQFPECGGNACADISPYYLSVVDGGSVVSFLDVTGFGDPSTAKWFQNNDLPYNSHRVADTEGRLSDYYYVGFTAYNFDLPYGALGSGLEAYLGSQFCRSQAVACTYNGISTRDNLTTPAVLLATGETRGFDRLVPVGSTYNYLRDANGYIKDTGLDSVTLHILMEMSSFPQATEELLVGIQFRGSLSTWAAPGESTQGVYASITRPSNSITVGFRGDGTMRFFGAGPADEIGRWLDTAPVSKGVYLVSVTLDGGIKEQFVDITELGNPFSSMTVAGNISVDTPAKTVSAYYERNVGGAAMNGGPSTLWSPYDFQGEETFGTKFGYQSSSGVNSSLIALSNDRTFDQLFRRTFNDYAAPDYCLRIP